MSSTLDWWIYEEPDSITIEADDNRNGSRTAEEPAEIPRLSDGSRIFDEIMKHELSSSGNFSTSSLEKLTLMENLGKILDGIDNEGASNAESKMRIDRLNRLIGPLEEMTMVFAENIKRAKKILSNKDKDKKNKFDASFLFRFTLPFVIILQAVNLVYLHMCAGGKQSDDFKWNVFEMSVTQVVCVFFVTLSTVTLTKQFFKGKVSGIQLAQNYVATVIVFSGIYMLVYRLKPSSIMINHKYYDDDTSDDLPVIQFIKMLYLSVSSATLCGDSTVQPVSWFVILIVCMQNMISFMYFASILAQTVGNYNTHTYRFHHHRRRSPSFTSTFNSI